jgi:hypothetical protein
LSCSRRFPGGTLRSSSLPAILSCLSLRLAASCFDLENPQDLARLEQPQLAMEDLTGLIVIDEIQRLQNLFPLLRYLVDQGKKRKFVILGSASRDLIRQSSESLAGRIAYLQLGGFRLGDIDAGDIKSLWWRGGLPPSFLAASVDESLLWRNQYVTNFLERDIPQLGITIPARTLRRFWTMLSHYRGQRGCNVSAERIKSWPTKERPRERLLDEGPERLTDADLLTIILRIGSETFKEGVPGTNAYDAALSIVRDFDRIPKRPPGSSGNTKDHRGLVAPLHATIL